MIRVTFILLFFFFLIGATLAQQADETKSKVEQKVEKEKADESFGDYVKKAGKSIWNRMKIRFNLDQRSDELKRKGQQIFGASKKTEKEELKTTVVETDSTKADLKIRKQK